MWKENHVAALQQQQSATKNASQWHLKVCRLIGQNEIMWLKRQALSFAAGFYFQLSA